MIVAIGQFQLKKRSLLPKFLILSKKIQKQALNSKGNIKTELNNEGIKYFYAFTYWESMDTMKDFVHTDFHLQALKETENVCKEASFLYYESDTIITIDEAKIELKNNTNTRVLKYN